METAFGLAVLQMKTKNLQQKFPASAKARRLDLKENLIRISLRRLGDGRVSRLLDRNLGGVIRGSRTVDVEGLQFNNTDIF